MKVREDRQRDKLLGENSFNQWDQILFWEKKALNKLNGVKCDMNFLYHTVKGSSYN